MRQVNENEFRVVKEAYASLLEDAAKSVRESPKLPEAAYVQIFWTDGAVTRLRHGESGFNLLKAVGLFECVKTDTIKEIGR